MGQDFLSKPDARATELSFRKNTGAGLSKEEEEELKRLQERNALKRRAASLSSADEDSKFSGGDSA